MCSWSRINFLVLELVDYYSRVQTLWYTGSSDGQTKVVREGDNGVAYAWNLREQKWDKVIIFYILHCLYQAFCYALVFMWLWNHPFLYFASFHLLVATVSIFSCTCNPQKLYAALFRFDWKHFRKWTYHFSASSSSNKFHLFTLCYIRVIDFVLTRLERLLMDRTTAQNVLFLMELNMITVSIFISEISNQTHYQL